MKPHAISLGLVLALAATAASSEPGSSEERSDARASTTAQAIYKGVVGNLLEAVPLETENRVQLQRLNAVIGGPLSGHSLAAALGIASPPLIVVGLIWGLWSAKQIQPKEAAAERGRGDGYRSVEAGERAQRSAAQGHDRQALASVAGRPAVERAEIVGLGEGNTDFALEGIKTLVDASALATVVGGAAGNDRAVPCDNCYMPMLYPRAAPDLR